MFFAQDAQVQKMGFAGHSTRRLSPAALTLAGSSSRVKTTLLLQYAYNAALKGERGVLEAGKLRVYFAGTIERAIVPAKHRCQRRDIFLDCT